MNINISNQWLYTIELKNKLNRSNDVEYILELAGYIKNELIKPNGIKEKVNSSNLIEEDKYEITNEIFELEDSIDFLTTLKEDITVDEWEDYSFDGNYLEYFNDNILDLLYDLGDKRVLDNKNNSSKLIFIK